MEKIIVNVAWCDKNFGGSLGSNVPGAVIFTALTFETLLTYRFTDSLSYCCLDLMPYSNR